MCPAAERQPDSVLAWHFVGDTLRDGRPVPADGEVLRHDGPMELCESGLHASVRAIDALANAPGESVCRVRMAVDIQHEPDKLIARERTILWRIDATDVLRKFARQCALDVSHLWDMPDVVRRYLETGDNSLRAAAKDAARDAARVAGWSAWASAWAAGDAAKDAAWDTAKAAWSAWAFARDAGDAGDAAWDTARAAQNARLESAIYAAAGRTAEDDR